jgi:hypothetical protein
MNKFMDDVLTNTKMTTILYDSNAKIEIKSSLKLIKNFRKQNERYTKNQKEKFEPVSVVKRRSRKEAYTQMRTEIESFTSNKEKYKKNLLMKNYRKYIEMKKSLTSSKNEYINYLRKNRINSFKRAYDSLKLKIDDNMGRTLETEYSPNQSTYDKKLENYYLFRNNYIDCCHTINLPNIKCDINNVFSRLYHNKVLLTLNEKKDDKKCKSRKAISLNRHLHNNKNKKSIYLSNRKLIQHNPKVNLNLKNVFKSNGGKEFTIKVTAHMLKKCLDKYSGGPEAIKFLKDEFSRNVKTRNNIKNINTDGFVNFYELTEKNTGNSYLHLAILGDYPELVKYFIEKGADINKKNNEGDTPLHIAVRSKNNKIIKILLDNKAKLDIPNNEGEIPFDFFNNDMKKQYGLDKMLIINPTKNN